MIAIIDYGAGNLFSVKNALDFLGLENKITNSAADLSAADRLILPGVGAFPDAMRMLGETGLIGVIKEEVRKKPLLGICLGMQHHRGRRLRRGRCGRRQHHQARAGPR